MANKLKQYKICRRLGARVFSKCENPKFVLSPKIRSRTKRRQRPLSEFGVQLLEKQKVRYLYGLRERQFSNYVKVATSKKGVNPAQELFKNLESRLDNTVFHLGFAKTRPFARQMISHGHIVVNGRKVTIPSYKVKKGDRISVRPGSGQKALFHDLGERLKEQKCPAWLSLNQKKHEGVVAGAPALDDSSGALFNLTSVVEFYSR